MRFATIAATLLAPLCAQAYVMFTNNAYNGITAGRPFPLTWNGDGTPATIYLLRGPTQMLTRVYMVATGVSGSSYTWTPPQSVIPGTYALSITQSGATNYSPQFSITGNSVPTFLNTPTTTPALSPSPPSSTVGRAIHTSPPIQASAYAYGDHGPTLTGVSDSNTPSTTSYAYANTIGPTTTISSTITITTGSSLWLYPTGLINSSVPTGYKALPTGVDFADGATRVGGFGLWCSVAVMFAGALLARCAF